MNILWLIIKREYLTKIRNKSFIIMTFVSPLVVIAFAALIVYLTNLNNQTQRTVTVLDTSGKFAHLFKNEEHTHYEYFTQAHLDSLKAQSLAQSHYGLLYINEPAGEYVFFSQESPSLSFVKKISSELENAVFYQNLEKENIPAQQINKARTRVDIQLENFSGERTSKQANALKLIFGGAAGYLLMMFIVIYGNMIMRSVIEEKTNRIIEIIISSVKPMKLMLGKIIGTSLVGLTQFLAWLVIGGALMAVLSSTFGVSPSDASATVNTSSETARMVSEILLEIFKFPLMKLVFCFFLYFVGGYLLYSSLYVAIGAAVDNETDTQQFLFPILAPLTLAMYIGIFTVVEDPHGSVSTLFSYIPLTSPIVMLMRIPFGVSWWEILLSLALLYATFFAILWFAAKIYRVGILMYGKRPSYKDIYKWIKIKD